MWTYVAISQPTIKDAEAVLTILNKYDLSPWLGVLIEPGNSVARLALDGDADWPSAIRADLKPPFTDENDQAWYDAVNALHEALGQKGFADLLLELAPYLNQTLIFQAATFGDETPNRFGMAKEWTVAPGATEVIVKEIKTPNGFDSRSWQTE